MFGDQPPERVPVLTRSAFGAAASDCHTRLCKGGALDPATGQILDRKRVNVSEVNRSLLLLYPIGFP